MEEEKAVLNIVGEEGLAELYDAADRYAYLQAKYLCVEHDSYKLNFLKRFRRKIFAMKIAKYAYSIDNEHGFSYIPASDEEMKEQIEREDRGIDRLILEYFLSSENIWN